MLILYSARSCPFAQRARALLHTLGVDYDEREVDLDARDPKFLAKTPTGAVPLLIDGKLELFESRTVNDYLAQTRGYEQAYDEDPGLRALEQLAMANWDSSIVRLHMRALKHRDAADKTWRQDLTAHVKHLLRIVHQTKGRIGGLLSFHVATFWARIDWLRDDVATAGVVDEFVDLRKWLDASVAQEGVQATLPDRESTVARYLERFRE